MADADVPADAEVSIRLGLLVAAKTGGSTFGFFAGLGSGAGDSFLTFEDALEVDAEGLDAEARAFPFALVVEAETFDLALVLVLRKASSSEDESEESESESTVRFRFFGAGFGSTGTAFTAG